MQEADTTNELNANSSQSQASSQPASPERRSSVLGLIKSLVSLDSYEQDIEDTIQHEDDYDEAPQVPIGLPKKRKHKNSPKPVVRPPPDPEFEAAEKKRDEALPEHLRHLRPRGYEFNIPPENRSVRIYADGVFDLFHLGHMKQLQQAKHALPNAQLIVGVPSDKVTHKLKGLTVLADKVRCESLEHCKWVDEVVSDAPWEVNQEFLDKHNIDYVAHDDIPYESAGSDDVYKFVKQQGRFLVTQRTGGISTSDIITRIIRDYDLYLMRNFARGVSRKELNVSWLKKNEMDLKRHVNEFRKSLASPKSKKRYADNIGLFASFSNRSRRNERKFVSRYDHQQQSLFNGVCDWVAKRLDSPASKTDERSEEDHDDEDDEEDEDDDEDDNQQSTRVDDSETSSHSERDDADKKRRKLNH